MKDEYLIPAALLTQTVLKDWKEHHNQMTPEILASAFVDAYKALELAKKELNGREKRPLPPMKPPSL